MFRFASYVCLVALVAGCAGSGRGGSAPPDRSSRVATGPFGVDARAEAPAAANDSFPGASSGDYSAPSDAPAAPAREEARGRSSANDAYTPKKSRPAEPREDRPGLGTEWGATRTSRVSDAPFERRTPGSPWSTTTLYYNDAEGIASMTRGASLSSYTVSSVEVANGALSVRLLDAGGSVLPTYDLGSRSYVTGRHGDRYIIEIRNHTGQRFEAVASVDGLDVIDGRSASPSKRGYLIAPWGNVQIEGFRRNLDEVAEFRFGSVSDSYAARTGTDRNVGVIGVAFFDERGSSPPWLERESRRRHDADPFPGRFAAPPR
ncbi:MAG: hypothetical protein M3020_14060 [Myxococcota bacterium]|jgi:hypothetical protein|nr:hypothetical protein [Myxococcota bacterium]